VKQRTPTERRQAADAIAALRRLLPPGWELDAATGTGRDRPDMAVNVTAPDGGRVTFLVEIKRSGAGSVAQEAVEQLRTYAEQVPGARTLFVAPWLSQRSRELLAEADVAYLDATGNTRLVADRPGLFVQAVGANKNPWPTDSALKSLRGKGAARAVRALVDFRPPYGIRELAERSSASASTLSRVADLLESEGLLERDPRGSITNVDWAGTIRRWTQDYDVQVSNETTAWLAPRGLESLKGALRSSGLRYALTGSLAANEIAPYAPARLGMVYVDSLTAAAEVLDLRAVDAGANVWLLAPLDDVAFERVQERDGLTLVSPSQLAADLLTSPGRSPSEGEELLRWMDGNLDAWRA
jgi:hypothetical protein